jgi:hypothetical protein
VKQFWGFDKHAFYMYGNYVYVCIYVYMFIKINKLISVFLCTYVTHFVLEDVCTYVHM